MKFYKVEIEGSFWSLSPRMPVIFKERTGFLKGCTSFLVWPLVPMWIRGA